MSPIKIADEALITALAGASRSVGIYTEDGRQLGVFTPVGSIPPDLEPKISEEEILRRLNDRSGKWYTAAEVEAKLREWQCSK
jgi:hypothetical protein